jgi:hypothetical protein
VDARKVIKSMIGAGVPTSAKRGRGAVDTTDVADGIGDLEAVAPKKRGRPSNSSAASAGVSAAPSPSKTPKIVAKLTKGSKTPR